MLNILTEFIPAHQPKSRPALSPSTLTLPIAHQLMLAAQLYLVGREVDAIALADNAVQEFKADRGELEEPTWQ